MGIASHRIQSLLPHRTELGAWAFTFISFLLGAKLGQFIYMDLGSAPAFIWPPYGIALASIFLFGYRMWSAIALAAFVASVSGGSELSAILISTFGNTTQALIGGFFFKLLDFRPDLTRLRDTILLILGSLVFTTIVPTVSYLVRFATDTLPADPSTTWRVLWAGGILSVLILTPLITGYAQNIRIIWERWIEHTFALGLLTAVTYVLFWAQISAYASIPLAYVLLAPFFWISLRFPPRSTSLALFLTTVIALSGAMIYGPADISRGSFLFQTQLFLEMFAIIFLILATVIEERRVFARQLGDHVTQLEVAIAQIKNQDTAKSDFLAVLAHELRNPLAPVLSTLELLRIRRTESEESDLIRSAEQRLVTMGRLLDDLLDISRISEKRLELKKESVPLRELILRSIESAKPMIEKHGHTLSLSLPADQIALFADPVRVEQVLVNILHNAAKYTPRGGRITLSSTKRSDMAEIRISDNGTGIEQSMLNRIFEPFLQIAASTQGTSGVGVGLALSKELVEMHGGTIHAESEGLGAGSTFVICFPISHTYEPMLSTPSQPLKAPDTPLSILIIDDNEAGAEALGRLLALRGHRMIYAYTGGEGITSAAREHPDVILLDIGLPDMSGYDVARALKHQHTNAYLIALTGYGQEEDKRKAHDAGCDAHLVKPVSLRDIERTLATRNVA